MRFNWDYMKGKQIYFVEADGKIVKFIGFDDLEKWVDKQKPGKEWTTYFVSTIMTSTKKQTNS